MSDHSNHTDNIIHFRRPQVRQNPQLLGDLKVLVTSAYDFGFKAGEHVGKALAERERAPAVQSALKIGFIIGVATGSTAALVVLDFLSSVPS